MTNLDLAAIRERARLCAYQEWEDAGFNHRFQEGEVVADNASVSVAIVDSPYDLEHVAGMDPATTIALLDEIDRLNDLVTRWKDTANAADNVIRATLAELHSEPDSDPVLIARKRMAEIDRLNATIQRVRELAEKMQDEQGQSWNAISGNRIRRALEGGEAS